MIVCRESTSGRRGGARLALFSAPIIHESKRAGLRPAPTAARFWERVPRMFLSSPWRCAGLNAGCCRGVWHTPFRPTAPCSFSGAAAIRRYAARSGSGPVEGPVPVALLRAAVLAQELGHVVIAHLNRELQGGVARNASCGEGASTWIWQVKRVMVKWCFRRQRQ